ncbi:MAG: paraquat-inducible protein A [Flavimaricola sp.]|nr:paraquat-inducible protein A [Flavimaricola sp.]
MSGDRHLSALTARDAGLVACRRCTRVWPGHETECGRCGASLASRDDRSLSRVWAWWVVGLICYVPANLYPMLSTRTLLSTSEATIVGGAIELIHHGSIGIAIVILVASVLIPMAKFACIAFLALTVERRTALSATSRQHLYELVEYVGRWSMIDVFVVAILSSLVQLNVAATINPGPASLAFALSVIFTMLSAQAFDSRLIWDGIEEADRPDDLAISAAGRDMAH